MTGNMRLLVGVLLVAGWCGCAPARIYYTNREAPLNLTACETALQRGVSTAADVRRLLGEPNGTGSLLLPGDPQPRTIWVYSKIEVEEMDHLKWFNCGHLPFAIARQSLLVYFKGETLDGFAWCEPRPL